MKKKNFNTNMNQVKNNVYIKKRNERNMHKKSMNKTDINKNINNSNLANKNEIQDIKKNGKIKERM